MRFVYQNQVEAAQLASLIVHRLDSRDDYRFLGVAGIQARRIDSVRHIRGDTAQLVGGLLQEFLDMGKQQNAATPTQNNVATQGRHDGRFAAAGRDHDTRIVVARANGFVNGVNRFLLVRTQLHRYFDRLFKMVFARSSSSRTIGS